MDAPWESPVRRRLRESQPVFGCTLTTRSLDIAARAATAGFHFLWLELEHSPLTLETVRHIVLATRELPAVPFARVPETEAWSAKRVLDAGVHGVVFPFVSTPALARQAADACRYPPAGLPRIRRQLRDRQLAGSRRLLRLGRSQHRRRRRRRAGIGAGPRRRDRRHARRGRGLHRHGRYVFFARAPRSAAAPESRRGGGRGARRRAPSRQDRGTSGGDVRRDARYIEQGFLFFQAPSELALFETGAEQFLGPHGIGPARRQRTLY